MNRSLALVGSVLFASTVAWSDQVVTTPPVIHQTGEGLTCVAVNVGNNALFMKADVMEFFNDEPLDSEQDVAAPGFPVSASGDGNYCRFTLQKKRDVRAAAHVRTGTGTTLAVVGAQ